MPREVASSVREQLAEDFLLAAGAGDAPDALELARFAGLSPEPAEVERAELGDDGVLRYAADARQRDQQRWVSFQVASRLLVREGLDASARASLHTASALMVPRRRFLEETGNNGWDVNALRTMYPNVSFRTLAARLVTLRPAAATWFQQRQLFARSVTPRFQRQLAEPTRYERHLAEIAFESDEVLHPEARIWAYPLNRGFGMTLLVCDAERLVAKL